MADPEIIHLDGVLSALNKSMMVNQQTGMGTARDSFTQTEVGYVPLLGEQELRSLHRGNWWIRRIVDTPPQDMVKAGISLKHPSNDAEAVAKVLGLYEAGGEQSPYSRKMGGAQAFQKAEAYARWFGRGYVVLRVNGDEKLDKPIKKVRSFEGFSVLDRYQLRPDNGSLNYEDPEYYQIIRKYQRNGSGLGKADFGQRIHETRVLPFDGAFIHPYDINLEASDGGHDSVIQALYECFCRHYSVQNAIAKGLDSYSLFKVAIANLGELMMQDEGETALAKTLNAIAEQVSLHRILVQDSDAANSEFQERSFTGVKENSDSFKDELTAASWPLPHYKIWGSVDKAGLADSGGAESRAYADDINTLQKSKFYDNHRRVFNALFEATTGAIPEGYGLEYPSIFKSTPKEEAEIKKTEADTYSVLITAEVLSPLEAKLAYATGESISNVLNAEEIEAELERAKELATKQLEVEEAELDQSVQVATATAEGSVEGVQQTIGGTVVPDLDTAISQLDSADFRTDKKKGKKRNCQKGVSCGNSCIARSKTCRKKPTAKQAGLAQQIRSESTSTGGQEQEGATPNLSDERSRSDELTSERNSLANAVGEENVIAAEENVQRIINDSDQFVMVPDDALDSIIDDGRLKNSVERFQETQRNKKPPEPDSVFGDILDDFDVIDDDSRADYNTRRVQQEDLMFRGTNSLSASERPIYGYIGDRSNQGAVSHQTTRNYGDVSLRLKPEVKERSTVVLGDSFEGGIPSSLSNVSAASLSRQTGIANKSQSLFNESAARGDIEKLRSARNVNDLIRSTGSPWMEFQAHGQVATLDIAEMTFYGGKRPSAKVRQWAESNNVKITLAD